MPLRGHSELKFGKRTGTVLALGLRNMRAFLPDGPTECARHAISH